MVVSRVSLTHLAIQYVYGFPPALLCDPVLDDHPIILVQASIEQVKICPSVAQDEFVNDLGFKVILAETWSVYAATTELNLLDRSS